VVLMMGMGVIFILVRTFNDLAEQFIIGIWPFYALAVAGVFVLRRTRPSLERPYMTWGYPWVPVVFLVAALFVLGNYLRVGDLKFSVDIGIILTECRCTSASAAISVARHRARSHRPVSYKKERRGLPRPDRPRLFSSSKHESAFGSFATAAIPNERDDPFGR